MAWAVIEYSPNDISCRPFRDDGGRWLSLTTELQEIFDNLIETGRIREGKVILIQNDKDICERMKILGYCQSPKTQPQSTDSKNHVCQKTIRVIEERIKEWQHYKDTHHGDVYLTHTTDELIGELKTILELIEGEVKDEINRFLEGDDDLIPKSIRTSIDEDEETRIIVEDAKKFKEGHST